VVQDVSLDDRWRNTVVVASSDERAGHLVLSGNRAKLSERIGFRFRFWQLQLPIQPDVFRNSGVDQGIEIFEADLAQHLGYFGFARANMATRE